MTNCDLTPEKILQEVFWGIQISTYVLFNKKFVKLRLMGYVSKIIRTSRPLFWFTHFTLLIFGGLQSTSFSFYKPQLILIILVFSLPFSLFIYAINDFYDLKSDLLNPRKGTIFGERHSNKTAKYLQTWGYTGLVVSLLAAYFISPMVLTLLVLLSVLLFFYSSATPHFKSIPLVDAVVGGGLYFYLTMVVGYFVFEGNQANVVSTLVPAFMLVALVGLAGHLMGTVLDEEPDRKAETNTSAVFFGVNKVTLLCQLILIFCLYLSRNNWIFLLFISAFITICTLGYSPKYRDNFLLQLIGGAFIPLTFFIALLILYVVNPNLLKI